MKLEDRKNRLLHILENKNIDSCKDDLHKEIIKISSNNIWILSNFGGQVVLNRSKKMIKTILNSPVKNILYNGIKVDYFAIPGWGPNESGKNVEDPSQWCFIEASKIFNSIKVYQDDIDKTWTNNPKKDWKANINKDNFYWKSDAGKHKIDVEWNNYKILTANKQYFSIDSDDALEGYKKDTYIFSTHRNKKIADERKQFDNFTCQSCGFSLSILGKFVIECHHLNPISEHGLVQTTIDDLVSLCPTCHRIAHLRKPPYTPEEISVIQKQKTIFKKT